MQNLQDLAKNNRIVIISVDETKLWKDSIIAKAKRIDCVYMVNLTQPTHLCEITASYPVIELRNVIANVEAFTEDELDELESVTDYDVRYFGEYFNGFKFLKAYNDEENTEEDVQEYESGNPTFC
jgi:hypothetical protein